MKEKKNIILTMAISGAFAGIGAGFLYLSGIEQWSCAQTAVPNMGFNGIATVFVKAINMAENPNNVASTIQYISQKKAFSIVKIAGFGFLALAVMIFGQWKPNLIALADLLFGLFRALSNVYAGFDFLTALNIPGTYYKMLPYIISLLVLAVSSKKSRAPKAEGIPYDKGQR